MEGVVLLFVVILTLSPPSGTATFYRDGLMEKVAEYRGYRGPRTPVAALSCADLGRDGWLLVAGEWLEVRVVDCSAAHDFERNRAKGLVAELPWAVWEELGLPLAPVPALLEWEPPRHEFN